MTVNWYLKNEIKQSIQFKPGTSEKKAVVGHFLGLEIRQEGVQLLCFSSNGWLRIQSHLQEYVERVTLHDYLRVDKVTRETGIYNLGKAKAEVTHSMGGGMPLIKVEIEGTDFTDVMALHLQIRSGDIRPTKSFERPQGGKTYEQLAADFQAMNERIEAMARRQDSLQTELTRALEDLVTAHAVIANYKSAAGQFADLVGAYARQLNEENWPWCSKATVAAMLNYYVRTRTEVKDLTQKKEKSKE